MGTQQNQRKVLFQNRGWRSAVSVFAISVFAMTASQSVFAASKDFVAGEVILRLKDSKSLDSKTLMSAQKGLVSALQQKLGQASVLSIQPFHTDASFHKVKLASGVDVAKAISALRSDSRVKYAEPNYIMHISDEPVPPVPVKGTPNDPDFGKLWGIQNTGQTISGAAGKSGVDVNVLPLWAEGYTGSKDILVAVIDTGVDWTHPDLKDNIYTNPGEIADNGIDDDGNGFIDDIHGWNFAANTNNSSDDHDHGSHCSGTIGGTGDNGLGVVGVNWNVSILPVKFLTASGSGTLEGAVESIKYATKMKVRIMSNSWGGGGFTQSMMDSIKEAKDAGILFVAAAGNDSGNDNDTNPSYPASYQVENVLSIAAMDNKESLASFSNIGKNSVHIAAPGVNVYSTTKQGLYKTFSGTSMATPHVSGVAALMMSIHPEWTVAEVKDRIIRTAIPVRAFKRKMVSKGRINAYNAVMGIETPSDEPDESLWQDVAFTAETPHPYEDSKTYSFKITQPGAKYVRVHFSKIEVESGYDKIYIVSPSATAPSGEIIETLTGNYAGGYTTDFVVGGEAEIRFESDRSVHGWGFQIDKIQVVPQNPTGEWITAKTSQ